MCPARRRVRRTASALLEVAMQSAFQEKFSYTMTVRGLLEGGGSVTVRGMRAFVVANKMDRGSGQSTYQALSHFTCKAAALRTAAQSTKSKNLCKKTAKGFLFVSVHLNKSPSSIGLCAN